MTKNRTPATDQAHTGLYRNVAGHAAYRQGGFDSEHDQVDTVRLTEDADYRDGVYSVVDAIAGPSFEEPDWETNAVADTTQDPGYRADHDLDQSDYEASGRDAESDAGYLSPTDLDDMDAGQLREHLLESLSNPISIATAYLADVAYRIAYRLDSHGWRHGTPDEILRQAIAEVAAYGDETANEDAEGHASTEAINAALADGERFVRAKIVVDAVSGIAHPVRFTGQDGVLTDADQAAIYGTAVELCPDRPTVLTPGAAPAPVQGQPEDLLTDLHRIADTARDALLSTAEVMIGAVAERRASLMAFAFSYVRPRRPEDTYEVTEARWLGLDQGMSAVRDGRRS